MATRTLTDEGGTTWEAYAADAIVAHGKPGAILAFRIPGAGESESIRSTIMFNSHAAADFALRTMSEKDLLRRLSLTRMALGGV